ncbi:MAG TPA: hypothetical protein VFS21_16365 [Roseiflexaceae bacterium]|nr:hypothetical protein [Roseiflexaceae bacterium]
MRKRYLICTLVVLALAGCGQAESPTGGSGASAPQLDATAVSTVAPTAAPLPTPAADQTPTQEPTAPAAPTDTAGTQPDTQLVQAARDDLAAHLGVPPEQLTLESAGAQEWPNSALGCPAADTAYMEVITPGFKMVFTNGTSDYAVHTAQSKEAMVLCTNDQPVNLSGTADSGGVSGQPIDGGDNTTVRPNEPSGALPGSQPVGVNNSNRAQVALARKELTSKAAVQDSEITVVSVEEVEWRDSSLGCPEPDVMYMQVITPGYRITLEAQGKRYTYHSDMGQQVIPCENKPRG